MKATRPSIRIMSRAKSRLQKSGVAPGRSPKPNLVDVVVALDSLHLRLLELERKIASLNAYH